MASKIKREAPKPVSNTQVQRIDPNLFAKGRAQALAVTVDPESKKAVASVTGGAGLSDLASFCSDQETNATIHFSEVARQAKAWAIKNNVAIDMTTAFYGNLDFGGKHEGSPLGKAAFRDLGLIKLSQARATKTNVIVVNQRIAHDDERAAPLCDALKYLGELLPDDQREQWENSELFVQFLGGDAEEPVIVRIFDLEPAEDDSNVVVSAKDKAGAIDLEVSASNDSGTENAGDADTVEEDSEGVARTA